jgi:dienelactone hydrolase
LEAVKCSDYRFKRAASGGPPSNFRPQEGTLPSTAVTYEADGLTMRGQLFRPAGVSGARPGVIVFPEAFGLGEHALAQAEKIAGLGYVALAADLHGEAKRYEDIPSMMPVLTELAQSPAKLRARAQGAMDALRDQSGVDGSKIAAIGYCFGGAMAIELGCAGADVAAIVGFHSGLSTINVDDLGGIKGRLLLCLGADDPAITPDQRVAFENGLRKGGVSWDMHLYGKVVHSFTNPAAYALGDPNFLRYDDRANTESFEAMTRLFKETLG